MQTPQVPALPGMTPLGLPEVPVIVKRSSRGELSAKTVVPLGFDRRELRIETSKSYNGGVDCSATCVQVDVDGFGYSCRLGLGGDGDYSKRLVVERDMRATEKNIRKVHAAALAQLDQVLAEVRAKYAAHASIAVGDRLHYSGDMANASGWFVVLGKEGGYLKLDEDGGDRKGWTIHPSSIGHKYQGHCSPRFVTQAAYDAFVAERTL
jgi:hypothetical protein